MKLRISFILMLATVLIAGCTATGEKATIESSNQAIADSIINSVPADSSAAPVELSPEAEEQH